AGGRHAGAAEVLLGQDVDGHLRPRLGNQDFLHLENDRTVGVDDPRASRRKWNGGEGGGAFVCVTTVDLHDSNRTGRLRLSASRGQPYILASTSSPGAKMARAGCPARLAAARSVPATISLHRVLKMVQMYQSRLVRVLSLAGPAARNCSPN